MDTVPTRSSDLAMGLLGDGVPLSLLVDIAWGPCSEELLATEMPVQRQPWP